MSKDKDEPKIVKVDVKPYDGWVNNYESTVVTDKGDVGHSYGPTEKSAIENAIYRANH
jgi:hypothetical protein